MTQTNEMRQSVPMKVPYIILSTMSSRVNTPIRRSCGGLYMISGWASSSPRPTAKNEDVTRFAHKISSGDRGKTESPPLSLKARAISRRMTCAMFEMSRCMRN